MRLATCQSFTGGSGRFLLMHLQNLSKGYMTFIPKLSHLNYFQYFNYLNLIKIFLKLRY